MSSLSTSAAILEHPACTDDDSSPCQPPNDVDEENSKALTEVVSFLIENQPQPEPAEENQPQPGPSRSPTVENPPQPGPSNPPDEGAQQEPPFDPIHILRSVAELRRRIDSIHSAVRERAIASARDRNAAVFRDRRAFAAADAEGLTAFFQRHPALQWYEDRANGPPSLQHLTRHAVRSTLGDSRMRGIHKLPLPQRMKKYLFLDSPDALNNDSELDAERGKKNTA